MSRYLKPICLLFMLWQVLGIVVTAQRTSKSADSKVITNLPINGIVDIVEFVMPNTAGKNKNKHKHKKLTTKKPTTKKRNTKKPSNTRELRLITSKGNDEPHNESKIPTSFLMKLRSKNIIICMGSLITRRLVLSSSSCFPKNPNPLHYKLEDIGGQQHDVHQIFLGTSSGFELAIMMLLKNIAVDYLLQPIPLCSSQPRVQDNVDMYMTKSRVNFLRTQIVENAIYVAKDCELTAKGDPLLREGQLCGINVYGPNCVEGAVNGNIYVNLFKARGFIERTGKI